MFEIFVGIIALAAFLSYLNIKFLKFPETIGVMILSIVVSLLVAASYFIDQTYFDLVIAFARSIDFKSILFDFLLGALLFAGAIHVNLKGLLEQKRAVIIDATFGVLRSTFIIGTLFYFTASFSNHTGITPKKPIIQIDFDPLALSKFQKVEVAVWGEISRTLAIFNSKLKGQINTEDQRKEVAVRWDIWKAEKKKRLLETSDNGISSIAVFETMHKPTPENAVMCVDVGNNVDSSGRYFEPKNQDFLMSSYIGSIGFALPATMGAWAAVRDSKPVIAVAGDGGLCQYLAEITTLVKYDMPVKLIVLNNHELGKISKEQRTGEFDVWKTSLSNPNFAEFACGAWGKRGEKQEDFEAAMQELYRQPKAGVLEIITDVNLI
jgi:thiamine pyrophosphate-dependent acetolactate synthase large subunit-like protein